MPTPFALQLSSGCTNGTGFIRLDDAGDPASTFDYTIADSAGGFLDGGTISLADLPRTLEGLANDTYTVTVAADGGLPALRRVTIACSTTLKIQLANVVPTPVTVASGTGSLQFDVVGNGPRAFDVYLYRSSGPGATGQLVFNQLAATNPSAFQIAALPAGGYNLYVYAVDPTLNTSDVAVAEVAIGAFVPAPRGGCPDRSANNYDAAATFNDGSCVYPAAPVPDPVFEVPLLNPLRFVQPAILDDCQVFETPENTLFCQQQRPGMQCRPLFLQPVAFCDPLRVQVLSNYPHVEAVLHRLADNQVVGAPQPLTVELALTGAAPFVRVELSSDGTGNTYLIAAGGGLAPSLLASPHLRLRLAAGGPEQTFRILRSGLASATVGQDFLVLDRPWAEPSAGSAPDVSWLLRGPGFNVWEGDIDLSSLAAGEYYVRLHAYDDANRSAAATSEPLRLSAAPEKTVVLEYGNVDNAFGMVFNTGIRPRLRVPGTFFRQKNAGTLTEHRNSDGTAETLASTAQRLTTLEVYGAPAWMHEKLFLATRLDYLVVNGRRGHVSGAYEAPELRQYPLSAGRVDVEQREWLGAGNADDAGNDSGDNLLVLRTGGFLRLRKP